MARLSHRDYDACSAVVRELYAEPSLSGFRRQLQPLLSRVVPNDYSSLNAFNKRRSQYSIQLYPNRPELDPLKPRFGATAHTHPFYDHITSGVPGPGKISDRATLREFRETAVYQEYYRHAGLRHQMFFFFHTADDGTNSGIGLSRWHRDFSERDRSVLAFLLPHIQQAYTNALLAGEARFTLDALGEGLDSLRRTVLLCRPDGFIRWSNPLAREWLREFFPEFDSNSKKLPTRLQEWINRRRTNLNVGLSAISDLQLYAATGYRLVAYCVASKGGDFLIALARERAGIAPEAVKAFDLTARETELLFWLSEAKTNPEIAAILGISPRTIHKHAEHLFAKLRVNNRLEAQRMGLELRKIWQPSGDAFCQVKGRRSGLLRTSWPRAGHIDFSSR